MSHSPKDSTQKPVKDGEKNAEQVNKQQHKAEQAEIAGRHKNDGQKDHKGAR